MKKTITLIAFMVLGLLYNATSQSSSDSSVIQKSEFIIEHLNKNNIPTGVLYDMMDTDDEIIFQGRTLDKKAKDSELVLIKVKK